MIEPELPSGPGRDDWSIGEAHDESTRYGESCMGSICRSQLGGAELLGFRDMLPPHLGMLDLVP